MAAVIRSTLVFSCYSLSANEDGLTISWCLLTSCSQMFYIGAWMRGDRGILLDGCFVVGFFFLVFTETFKKLSGLGGLKQDTFFWFNPT